MAKHFTRIFMIISVLIYGAKGCNPEETAPPELSDEKGNIKCANIMLKYFS